MKFALIDKGFGLRLLSFLFFIYLFFFFGGGGGGGLEFWVSSKWLTSSKRL